MQINEKLRELYKEHLQNQNNGFFIELNLMQQLIHFHMHIKNDKNREVLYILEKELYILDIYPPTLLLINPK